MFQITKRLLRINLSNKNFKSNLSSSDVSDTTRRIFSGIQPTGTIHLGNYLGAIVQWKKFQNQNQEIILEIADLHSITLPQKPNILNKNILELTATLLACGIDPDKVLLFQQSAVSNHAELCWILGCISTMARLAHLPAFKEKSEKLKDIPLGLYVYPILQAADILAYKATHVPVGEDQRQHIQLTQDVARMFNKRYGNTFPIPRTIIVDSDCARLKSLRDPTKKMSKSDPDPKSRISLLDKPEDILNKLKKAITDFNPEISFDPQNRPGISNLVNIYALITNKTENEVCIEAKGLDTLQFKTLVAEAVIAHLDPIKKKYLNLCNDENYLFELLKKGEKNARQISNDTIEEVKEKMGLKIMSTKRISEKKIVYK